MSSKEEYQKFTATEKQKVYQNKQKAKAGTSPDRGGSSVSISSVSVHISKLATHVEKQSRHLCDVELGVNDDADLFLDEDDDIIGNNRSNEALGRQPHVAGKKKWKM